jgi:hypothetical protein
MELVHCARRIQGRAIRRCGELLNEIEKAKGGQPFQKNSTGGVASPSRKQAATDAGLSSDQAKTAIRVANIPEESFEAQVESDEPPTISALAEQGKRPSNSIPDYERLGMTKKAFQAGMYFGGDIMAWPASSARVRLGGDLIAGEGQHSGKGKEGRRIELLSPFRPPKSAYLCPWCPHGELNPALRIENPLS